MKKLVFCAFLCSLIYSSLHAQTSPRVISYQGLLRPAGSMTGSQIAGNRLLTVTLYGDANGTVKLWQSTINTLIDSSGVFNCLLGTPDNPLPNSAAMDRPMWIGIAVDHNSEMRPLAQFTASPYALNVADSSITSSKLNMNYVSSISVNGQPITGQGTNLNIVSGDGVNVFWDATEGTLMLSGAGSNTGAGGGDHILSIADTIAFWSGGTALKGPSANSVHLLLHGDPGGGSGSPTWSAVNLLTDVTDTLQQSNGGTDGIPKWGGFVAGTNTATDSISVVAGGSVGDADNFAATVGGGFYNSAYGDDAVVSGGEANWVGNTAKDPNSYHSAIGGGAANTALGIGTAIPGGVSLSLGSHSFGFNGDSVFGSPPYHDDPTVPYMATITDLSATGANLQQVAYFGNVNMMIGNVDDAARQIQFYSPNSHYNYSGAHYTSFQAGGQTANIYYTLPTTAPDSLGWVLGIGGASGPDIQLQWQRMDTGSGGGGIPAWYLSGNTGTTPGPNFLGTIDDTPFEIHIDNSGASTGGNQRVMRYSVGSSSPNLLGGSSANTLGSGLTGAAILSGGTQVNPNILNYSDTFSIVVGGSANVIDSFAPYSAILSGQGNLIQGDTTFSGFGWHNGFDVIAGGRGNFMGADDFRSGFNVIGGGDSNFVGYGAYDNVIGGGRFDTVSSSYSVITGGLQNLINGPSTLDFVGGGQGNIVGGVISVNSNANYSSIVGGDSNTIRQGASYSALVGGTHNTIDSGVQYAHLGGGFGNHIGLSSDTSVLLGGSLNDIVNGKASFLGGGAYDSIYTPHSVIVGGEQNAIEYNDSGWSVIVGGFSNGIIGQRGFIGGGCFNIVSRKWGTIVGGCGNKASDTLTFVGGGQDNTVSATGGTIVGGFANHIDESPTDSASVLGAIGGGQQNAITDSDLPSFFAYMPFRMPQFASIAGGIQNRADGQYSAMGGGRQNYALGIYATIPGGTGLVAEDYQTVIGRYNIPSGELANSASINKLPYEKYPLGNDSAEFLPTADMPLFIIGNGTVDTLRRAIQSDAFTVANAGYSSAYDNIGKGKFQLFPNDSSTRMGSTYANNTIEAAGYVIGSADSTFWDVGVGSVTFDTLDTSYTIVLNIVNQDGSPHIFIAGGAAITTSITLSIAGNPGSIVTMPLSITLPGTTVNKPGFQVITYDKLWNRSGGYGFQFHVVAR